jgi:lipopolysaccharide transport protein LptA
MACSLHRPAIAAALLCAAAFAAFAADRSRLPITVEARSSDFDYKNNVLLFDDVTIIQGEIRITSERAQASGLDFEDSSWEFSGNVRMQMPDASLASDTARVRFAKGEIQSATVTGVPATFEQRRKDELAQGRAKRIDYDLDRGTVELAGDAWVSDGRNEITGATLVYSTGTRRVISREQVVITIKPRERQPAPAPTSAPIIPE